MGGLGLVLAGGGGKGAYEIGVWKALNEFGVSPNVTGISGASVGALNGALFAVGNYDIAERVWENISMDKILYGDKIADNVMDWLTEMRLPEIKFNIAAKTLKPIAQFGVLSRDGLEQLIDENVDFDMLRSFAGNVYAASLHFPYPGQSAVEYFNLRDFGDHDIKLRLLASAAIPVVFGRVYIDREAYCDGGLPVIGDNVPIKPLYDDGIRTFIAVHLSAGEAIDRSLYPDATIIEIMPSDYLGGVLKGTMHFSPKYARKLMELGYCDAVRLLEPLYRMGLANRKYAEAFRKLKEDTDEFYRRHLEADAELAEVQKSIDEKDRQLRALIGRK